MILANLMHRFIKTLLNDHYHGTVVTMMERPDASLLSLEFLFDVKFQLSTLITIVELVRSGMVILC